MKKRIDLVVGLLFAGTIILAIQFSSVQQEPAISNIPSIALASSSAPNLGGSGSSSSTNGNNGPSSFGQSSSGGPSGSGAEESSPLELGGVSQKNNTGNQTLMVTDSENMTSSNSS